MSEKDWQFRVQHMLNAIAEIEEFVSSHTYESFAQDLMCYRAIERNLEIIAEASKHIPESVRKDIPYAWPDIIGMRNIISHNYENVESPVIWSTIKEDLPELKTVLMSIGLGDVQE